MGRPRSRLVPIRQAGALNLIVLLLLFVAATLAGIALGRYSAERGVRVSPAALASVQVRLTETRDSLDVALDELEVLRTQREVDKQALEMLRAEMAAERERTAKIEESLSFYRSLMGSDGAKGLQLRKPELVPVGDGRIAYRFFVQQREREYDLLTGSLSVQIRGQQAAEQVDYTLAQVSEDFPNASAALQFRYFQAVEGELLLPAGFKPSEIILSVSIDKPRKTEVSEVYPWALQERFINVGQ
jgi:hypothetical protein